MRPKVHVEKHVFQVSLFSVASGAITGLVPCAAKQTVTAANAAHIREGSTVSAIYVEMWLTSDDTAAGTAIVTLEKREGAQPQMTTTESAALDAYDNKKNVLHTFMGLLGPNTQYPMAVIKGWIKIPKGKQRFGIEDKLVLNIHGQSNGVSGCGFFIYKEQY